MVSNSPVALCHPLPYGRRAAPSRKDGGALEGKVNSYATPVQEQRRDARPAGSVTSVAIGLVRPSPPSRRHPRRCGSMRRRDTATPATVPCTTSCQRHPRVLTRAVAEQETATPPPSKPLLGAHRTCHDAPPEVRFAKTTVYSVALYAMPSHVARTVRHACKLLPPWPMKGEAVPQPQERQGDKQQSPVRFPPSPRYWHLPQSVPLGPGGLTSSPASLVAPLYEHHGATQYSAPSTPLLDVRPPAGTRIKPSVTSCLAPVIER
jgi:hypothetical protein